MKKLISVIVLLAFMFISVDSGLSQDMPKAKKMENKTWHQIVLIDFESGESDKAMEIIHDHFIKASEKAGTPQPRELVMQTGKWDLMVIWDHESPSFLAWEVAPEQEKFFKALAEMEGGAEQAHELFDEYYSTIEESKSFLATSDNK